jgi:hypothetical protein
VDLLRALARHDDLNALAATLGRQAVSPMQHLAGVNVVDLALVREVVNLIDHEPQRAAIVPEQSSGKVHEQPRAFADGQLRHIEDRGTIAGRNQFRDMTARSVVNRQVAMSTAEDDYGIAGRFSARAKAQSPPIPLGVDDAHPSLLVK